MSAPETQFFHASDAYEQFMGRYSRLLASEFVRAAGVTDAHRVLDVGCGTGALTRFLADAIGPERVAAADPSEPFVEACRREVPGVDVRTGPAEALPFQADTFDCSLAQLVFHFVADPAKAVSEMARVTRPGGRVGACVWDMKGGMAMLAAYWEAAREVDPGAPGEERRFGVESGQLAHLWRQGGLDDVVDGTLTVATRYRGFDELWEGFLAGVGPAGSHAASLGGEQRDAVRDAFHRRVGSPEGPFELSATAWYAIGTVH